MMRLGMYIFFSLLLFALSNMPIFAKELKIIQITDSHFATLGQGYSERDVSDSQSVLEKTIEDINTIKDKDFVIFTGDNIDKSNKDELESFLKIANKLNCPYYIVIGNHEVFKFQHFSKKDYMKTVRKYSKNCRAKNPNYIFEKKGIAFFVVDGAKEMIPGAAGYFREDTLRQLDKNLKKYEKKGKNVVIFQHFPIVPPYYNRTHATFDVDGYKNILEKHSNVIAIVSGHYHANGEKLEDGVYHISTPSLLEYPHNYKVIEIKTQKNHKPRIYTQLRHADVLF
ncbi:MAG: hypothetical protein DKM22_05060 [Candidatus Melainabacteria bacterium]|nr:MAG: hypothetical protein DKM22_05060 [Candidatus Melainabacteria bacterium]